MLDDEKVMVITPTFTAAGSSGSRIRLVAKCGRSFQGSYVRGMGFHYDAETKRDH